MAKSIPLSRPLRCAKPDALFVAGQTYLIVGALSWSSRRRTTVSPRLYGSRSYPDIGGLMSYGADVVDAYRQVGLANWPHPERREALGIAGRAAIEIPTGDQRANCLGYSPSPPAIAPQLLLTRWSNDAARVHHAARRRGMAWPLAAHGQQSGRIVRIGILSTANPRSSSFYQSFERRLRDLGRIEGQVLRSISALRSKGINTPALILSALDQIDDRVKGCGRAATTICPSPIRFQSCWRAQRSWRGPSQARRKWSIASATSSSTVCRGK